MKPQHGSLQLWVTNVSKRNIYISDLRIRIPAGAQWNLLMPNLGLTLEQLTASVQTGSLSKLEGKIRLGKVASPWKPPPIRLATEPTISPKRFGFQMNQVKLNEHFLTEKEMEEDSQAVLDFVEDSTK